jgi:hypothetical protein
MGTRLIIKVIPFVAKDSKFPTGDKVNKVYFEVEIAINVKMNVQRLKGMMFIRTPIIILKLPSNIKREISRIMILIT